MRELDSIILTQLYNESRYYRQFHHFIFSLAITLYSAIMGLQIPNSNFFCTVGILPIIAFVIVFYILFPIIVIKLIKQYHIRIANLYATKGRIIKQYLQEKENKNCALSKLPRSMFDIVTYSKYCKAQHSTDFKKTGKGHKYFIVCILFLLITNIITTVVICYNCMDTMSTNI